MLKTKLPYKMLDKNIRSVAELSRQVDISRETLRKIYNGERLETVSLDIIQKLCVFFNCQVSDLIEYVPDSETTNE